MFNDFNGGPKLNQQLTFYCIEIWKRFESHAKLKCSCSVISDTGLFLLEEATADSGSYLLTEVLQWGNTLSVQKRLLANIKFLLELYHLIPDKPVVTFKYAVVNW